jgi:hypothetical protein
MATLPTDPAQLLARIQVLGPQWVEHAAELGLSPEMIAELETTLAECGDAAAEARRLRDAAQSATQLYYNAADRLYRASASIVRTVRTNALITGDVHYYINAGIDIPGPRRRKALPPGKPYALRATLDSLGAVDLSWKSKNPRGVANVIYEVTRQVFFPAGHTTPSDTDFRAIGLAGGSRTFTDESIPAGAATVYYQVRPLRGRQKGEASPVLIVRFGAATQRVVEAKRAA